MHIANKELTPLTFFFFNVILLLGFDCPCSASLAQFCQILNLISYVVTYYFSDLYVQFCVTCKFDTCLLSLLKKLTQF